VGGIALVGHTALNRADHLFEFDPVTPDLENRPIGLQAADSWNQKGEPVSSAVDYGPF